MAAEAAQQERGKPWDGVVRREVPVHVRVLDQEERSIEVVASTEDLDSHGDIVKQHWDLSRYAKNGPVLWNHNIHESSPFSMGGAVRPEDTMPVGKGVDVRVEDGQLVAKLVLVKASAAEEPLVDKLWRRIQQGVVRAVSVGFRPGQINRILNADGSTKHWELGSVANPNELREISFVPMGSNPGAVAKSIAFERENFARMTGPNMAATSDQENAPMAMTAEEQKSFDQALKDARDQRERAEVAEKGLAAEKTNAEKLGQDLATASARAKAAEDKLIDQELKALVGSKITPAELDEEITLAKEIGLDRVLRRLEKRADLGITKSVTVDGHKVAASQEANPAPADGSAADGSSDITKGALAASKTVSL